MLTFVLRHVGALITKQAGRLKPSYMRETGGEERGSAVGYGAASRGRWVDLRLRKQDSQADMYVPQPAAQFLDERNAASHAKPDSGEGQVTQSAHSASDTVINHAVIFTTIFKSPEKPREKNQICLWVFGRIRSRVARNNCIPRKQSYSPGRSLLNLVGAMWTRNKYYGK